MILIVLLVSSAAINAQRYNCLPAGVTEKTVVNSQSATGNSTSAGKALKSLGARCSRGSLIDRNRRKIVFFHMQTCWGNPPADYQDVMAAQQKEIARLRKRSTVILVPCDSDQRA